jgi:hypothetical protein
MAGSQVLTPDSVDSKKLKQAVDLDEDDVQQDYYLSGLFNIESTLGYKALDNLKNSKDVPAEKYGLY